jgi:hypothetical protein
MWRLDVAFTQTRLPEVIENNLIIPRRSGAQLLERPESECNVPWAEIFRTMIHAASNSDTASASRSQSRKQRARKPGMPAELRGQEPEEPMRSGSRNT